MLLEGICCGVGADVWVGVELLSFSPVIVGWAGHDEAVHDHNVQYY